MKSLIRSEIPVHLREVASVAAAKVASTVWETDKCVVAFLYGNPTLSMSNLDPSANVSFGKAYCHRVGLRIIVDRIEVPDEWLSDADFPESSPVLE